MRWFIKSATLLLIANLFFNTPLVFAYDANTERRINIGLRLFRTLLASDINIQQKVDEHNQLNLLLVSSSDISTAQAYKDNVLNIGRGDKKGFIHNLPIKITTITASEFSNYIQPPVAGIYIVEKLSDTQLQAIINYGIAQQIIVYSPFEGDVEQGALAGISIGIQVRPYINKHTLAKSRLTIKALFLKVANIYEN